MADKLTTTTVSTGPDTKGFLKDCILRPRQGGGDMFSARDGAVIPHLDRYAIIPVEEYHTLRYLALGSAS